MKAVVMTKHGPPEALQVLERPDPPSPEAGEVTVDVAAVGVNFAEVLARIGLYPSAPKPPAVVGFDIAGTVSAVGDGVEEFAVGDRAFGAYAERQQPAGRGEKGAIGRLKRRTCDLAAQECELLSKHTISSS